MADLLEKSATSPELVAIEKLHSEARPARPSWVLVAVLHRRGWGEGQRVSAKEYEAAVDEVLNARLVGPREGSV